MTGRRTILIVDDDPSVTRTFARMLRMEDYDVYTALDVESALREVSLIHPDAVLLDLRIPREDGIVFLRRLRAQEAQRDTPVAIITGDYIVDESICTELRNLDALIYFKPLWIEDLLRIAKRLLRSTGRS
jgi:DNA-binding response OmpR family regulator